MVEKRTWRCETCGAMHIQLTETLESQLRGLLARADYITKQQQSFVDELNRAIGFLEEKPIEEIPTVKPEPPLEVSAIPGKEAAKPETPPPQKQKR